MKITIKSIDISYFKGIKHQHIDFEGDITSIYGANGTGKTTIADAIQWCLFGKNAQGDTKFAIKTLDKDGVVIPNVEHSVKLSLCVDGKQKDIKRVWVETRKTDKGRETNEVEHHAEYYINGEKFTKKDFDTTMGGMIAETTFRAVTSPTFFFQQKWQDQRALLQEMVGDIDKSSIDGQAQYKGVLEGIKEHETLDGLLKHLSYNIKQIMEKMKQIPARIDEQRQTMPEEVDWRDVEEKVTQCNARIVDYQQQMAAIKGGNGVQMDAQLRSRLDFARRRLDNMVTGARNNVRNMANEREQAERKMRSDIQALERSLQDIEGKKASYMLFLKRAKDTLADYNKQMDALRVQWKENNTLTFEIDEDAMHCPFCGHPYDPDKREKVIEEARNAFNTSKAARKEDMRKKVMKLKENIADCEAQITTYETFINGEDSSKGLQDEISEKNGVLNDMLSEPLPTAEELLEKNESYRQARTEAHELELQLDGQIQTNNDDTLRNLQYMIDNENVLLDTLNEQKARKATFDAHTKRIAELEEEDKTLSVQLDKLQWQEDIAKEYEQECNELLEETVNELFSVVKFRLFETLNNGERKPNCIATVNGVGFSDLNSAMKINAGRDVLNAMQKFYDAYAPCMTDNAESTLELLPIMSQDIRFYVSPEKTLVIK